MFQNMKRILDFLDNDICGMPVAVIGDVMLDRYYFGEVNRISPEAPVPVTRILSEKEVLGGAANVAHNLANLGCKVFLGGVAGADENRQRLCRLLAAASIDDEGLVTVSRPTTAKLRVIGGHQQMLRLDFEETGDHAAKTQTALKEYISALGDKGVRALIVSDYGKGVCSKQLCQYAIHWAAQNGIPAIVDPKGLDWRKYAGAECITPNLKELGEVVHASLANEDDLVEKAAERIRKRYNIANLIVTRSEKGLSLINSFAAEHIPTRAQEVFDVSGAGDTVIAVLGAATGAGLALSDAAELANLAAGIAVGKLGTYAVSRQDLLEVVKLYAAAHHVLAADAEER